MTLYGVASGEILAAVWTRMGLFNARDMCRLMTLEVYRAMSGPEVSSTGSMTHHAFEQSSFRNRRIGKGATRNLDPLMVRQQAESSLWGKRCAHDRGETTVHN
jgi:hypothetical protein